MRRELRAALTGAVFLLVGSPAFGLDWLKGTSKNTPTIFDLLESR